MAKMMQETAMNSLLINEGQSPQDMMNALHNLERFLPQSNHIMVGLKMKLVDLVIDDESLRAQFEDMAIKMCFQMLNLARLIAPGKSKLRGKQF